jgi:hypothetical protein
MTISSAPEGIQSLQVAAFGVCLWVSVALDVHDIIAVLIR